MVGIDRSLADDEGGEEGESDAVAVDEGLPIVLEAGGSPTILEARDAMALGPK